MKYFTGSLLSLFLLAVSFLSSAEPKGHKITEIGITHSGCYGTCPVYNFFVKSDGSFEYIGFRFVKRKGEFVGSVDLQKLRDLFEVIENDEFLNFKDKYTRHITDMSTISTTVVMDGIRKVVEDYAGAGPPELRVIEQSIDDLMASAKWKAAK